MLVIGAGPAGLVAAWQAARRGAGARLVSKGWGSLYWHAGCIDVLGYHPPSAHQPVSAPLQAVARLIEEVPGHPYAMVGTERVGEAVEALRSLCAEGGYPLVGSLERNWLLPSGAGAPRPTCLAPQTMTAGDLRRPDSALVVGFEQLDGFYPTVVAANLSSQGMPSRPVVLGLARLVRRRFLTNTILAGLFEQPDFREEVATAVRPKLGRAERVGFPAVLGMDEPVMVQQDLEARLGRPVFEIPTLPPSIPGMRLHRLLVEAIQEAGGSVFEGMDALSATTEDGRVRAVLTEAAARWRSQRASAFVLATGGILGGGIHAGHDGSLAEKLFRLPVAGPSDRRHWFHGDFLDPRGHAVYRAGLRVDARLRPLDDQGRAAYRNLFAAGGSLAGAEVLRERSLEGVALATGYAAGQEAAAGE
ncbi:MAG: glycerol-3-phosphate dehydrogenase subunit GlpB [Actinomycetota bacterium]|nr:glycerol-3-phosphate dehydrogenase subunit GlpB [Actinomycetota bacterium]